MKIIDAIKRWWSRPNPPPAPPPRSHDLVMRVFPDKRRWWRVQLHDRGKDAVRPILLITTGRGYKTVERAQDVAQRFAKGGFVPCHGLDRHGNHRLQYADFATGKKVFNTAGPMYKSYAEAQLVVHTIVGNPISLEIDHR